LDAEFIELEPFTQKMESSSLDDEWLHELQIDLLAGRRRVYRPRALAGLQKVRAENPGRSKGKRGGFRVYFIRHEDLGVIVLAWITDKDVEGNISPKNQRELRALMRELRTEIERYVEGR